MPEGEVRFGPFYLDLKKRELLHDGAHVKLSNRALDILCLLISANGELVTKDELLAHVWPDVVVGESNIQVHVSALRKALDQEQAGQTYVVTVPGRGYRFIGLKGVPPAEAEKTANPTVPDRPSIAVLPFRNLSDDVAQEYFVDGIVEDITTALSQFSQLFVVARSSSFTFKGRDVDVRLVGRKLSVRYLLAGSLRKANGQLRISVQLVNTQTAVQFWAAHFDGPLEQVFDLQDQITAGVVGVIAPKIEKAEIERAKRKPTDSLHAYDYYLHGLANLYQDTRETNDEALRLFGKAIELDPNFATAHGMLALCYVGRHWKRWVVDQQKEVSEVSRLVNCAVDLGRDDAMALSAAGMAVGLVVHDLDRAIVLLDRSLLLNPNLAISWVRSAWVRIFSGEFDLAIEHANRAMHLSPLDPFLVGMQSAIAFAHFCAERYDLSVAWAELATKEQPDFGPALRVLAASCAFAGRMNEAKEAIARYKETNAPMRISELWNYPFRDARYYARFSEALRKAGFLE